MTPHDRKLIEDVNRANYRLRRRNTFFGVPAALLYNDYAQWEQAAKARGLQLQARMAKPIIMMIRSLIIGAALLALAAPAQAGMDLPKKPHTITTQPWDEDGNRLGMMTEIGGTTIFYSECCHGLFAALR